MCARGVVPQIAPPTTGSVTESLSGPLLAISTLIGADLSLSGRLQLVRFRVCRTSGKKKSPAVRRSLQLDGVGNKLSPPTHSLQQWRQLSSQSDFGLEVDRSCAEWQITAKGR